MTSTASSATSSLPPPPPQWVIDLNTPPTSSKPKSNSFPDPPGYTAAASNNKKSNAKDKVPAARKQPSAEEMDTLKLKKAWEVALAPAKQLPMNAIGTPSLQPLFNLPHLFSRGPDVASAPFDILDRWI